MALLEKISSKAPPVTRESRVQSVMDNVNDILSTRRGFGSVLPDLGITDVYGTDSSLQTAREALIDEVKETLGKYEPRIEVLDFDTQDAKTALQLTFTLRCLVEGEPEALRLEFDALAKRCRVRRDG